MPQHLLLEGSDIDELLARVRAEHGPDARIVHAEQKLVGGVAGFFARRRFEVAVAVDDETRPPRGSRPPSSIEDLLALADAQDGAAPTSPPSAGRPPAPAQPPPTAAAVPTRAPGRSLSTESDSFDQLVQQIVARTEGDGRGVTAPTTATAAVDPPPSFVAATPRAEPDLIVPVAAEPPAAQQLEAAQSAGPDAVTIDTPADPRLRLLDALAAVAVVPSRELVGTQVVVGPVAQAREVAESWLRLCGLEPERLLDLTAPLAGPGERASALAQLRDETARPGVLVLVDGGAGLAEARRAGRRVAELGADAVTAVVDARWDVETTRAFIDALQAHGTRVDHLAAHGVEDVAEPRRLLEQGVEVTWLDARPATLGAWAAPYLDRL